MDEKQIIQIVSNELGIDVLQNKNFISKEVLISKINELLTSDFQRLISILYRMDVSEAKLKSLLKENPNADAAALIADLMIERQEQKIKSRQEYRRDQNISDEESW